MTGLRIDPNVCAALGKTPAQIARMPLDKFVNLVLDKGFRLRTSWHDGEPHGMDITMSERAQETTP